MLTQPDGSASHDRPCKTRPMSAQAASDTGLSGVSGLVADVIARLGEVGVGLLTAAETVFPPIPSEVVLPFAGYLAQRGSLDPTWVLVAATLARSQAQWRCTCWPPRSARSAPPRCSPGCRWSIETTSSGRRRGSPTMDGPPSCWGGSSPAYAA